MQAQSRLQEFFSGYPAPLGAVILLVQLALGIILFATFQDWAPDNLGASDAWGGYLLAAYGAARFTFETPAGALSDRIERRVGLLIGFALMLPAIALMATIRDQYAYLGCAALLGFSTSFIWPAAYAISADLYPVERRGSVIGFLNLAQLVGFGGGAVAGAFLVRSADGLQFAVAGTAVVAAIIAAALALPAYRGSNTGIADSVRGVGSLRAIASQRLALLTLVVFLGSTGLAMVVPAMRPLGEDSLGVSFDELTIALAPAAVIAAALYLPAGSATDRFGRTKPFLIGEGLIIAGLLVCAGTGSLAVAAAGATAVFAGNVLTVPALNAAILDLAPEAHRGAVIGLAIAAGGLGLAVGPAVGGFVTGAEGAPATLRLAAFVCACAAAGMALHGMHGRPPAAVG